MSAPKSLLFAASLLLAACGPGKDGGDPAPTPTPFEDPSVSEARAQFPRFLELQAGVISTTCSPNPGVCHNSNNHPNLETAGNTLAWIGAACNAELPNPLDGWDNCETVGHVLVADLMGVPWKSDIAWVEELGEGSWKMHLKNPATATRRVRVSIESMDGSIFFDPPAGPAPALDWIVTVNLLLGSYDVEVDVGTLNPIDRDIADSILATVKGGDPNKNAIWGATAPGIDPAAIFFPGDPAKSYLWGRITETVPGSRMPLANAPLTNAAYVAIACWIEGLDATPIATAEDAIDYDACAFAGAPIDYEVQ